MKLFYLLIAGIICAAAVNLFLMDPPVQETVSPEFSPAGEQACPFDAEYHVKEKCVRNAYARVLLDFGGEL